MSGSGFEVRIGLMEVENGIGCSVRIIVCECRDKVDV